MDAWRQASPYSAVGIYISGSLRTCPQDQLTADWVRDPGPPRLAPAPDPRRAAGQLREEGLPHRDVPGTRRPPRAQGRAEAWSAVAAAKALAIRTGSTLYYDLEDYDLAPDDCRQAALSFLSGWTRQLHALGFRSGVYSNIGAAINSSTSPTGSPPARTPCPTTSGSPGRTAAPTPAPTTACRAAGGTSTRGSTSTTWTPVKTYAGASMKIDLNWVDVGRGSVGSPTRRMCPGVAVDLRRYPALRKGSRGAAVKAAQCQLRKQRFTRAKPSGRYDAGTVKAVRKAQRRLDVRVTGRLDRRTWVALLSRGSRPLLKVGSTGDPVRRVQRALGAALGSRIRVDGLMSPRTSKAVARFQKRERLDRTGNVTTQTWHRLQAGG